MGGGDELSACAGVGGGAGGSTTRRRRSLRPGLRGRRGRLPGGCGRGGIEPVRLHESDDKVHLAGGWTRFNADDEPILSNRVTYILTRIEGAWGIQARFGTDSFAEGESVDATGAVGVVERHLRDFVKGDLDAVVSAFEFPLVDVGIGRVVRHADAADVRSALVAAPAPVAIEDVSAAQTRRDGVVVAARWLAEQEVRTSAVFLVARRGDRWRIVGYSGMRG